MNDYVLYLLNFLLIFIEVVSQYLIASCFFQCKYRGVRLYIFLLLLLFISIIAIYASQGVQILKILLLIIIDTLWMKYMFGPHFIKCLVTATLFLSFMLAGDNIFFAGLNLFMEQDFYLHPYGYYFFCYVVKIIELIAISALRLAVRSRSKFQMTHWSDWRRVLMFPILSIVISVTLAQIYLSTPDAALQVLFCSVVLVLTDLVAIFLLNYLEQQQQALHDYSILQHSIKLEQDNVTAWMNAYTNQRKQTHEFQHQLAYIGGLAQQENPNSEVVQYVNQLLQTDLSEALFVNTGRTAVDVILNQKHAVAQSKGIKLQVQLDDLSNFALPDASLVVILSNLIDNAIEACEKIENPALRVIHLKMRSNSESDFLYIDNPTAAPVQIIDNYVVTTPKKLADHGYGLKNIAALLAQHDAEFAMDYQEETHLFCFSAQIIPPET